MVTEPVPGISRESQIYGLVLGVVIARLREHNGWTQAELAAEVGTKQPTLSRIERGKSPVDVYLHRKLAEAFELTPAELHGVVDKAYELTADAVRRMSPTKGKAPWWKTALKIAGAAGLAGLVAYAVSASLPKKAGRPNKRN